MARQLQKLWSGELELVMSVNKGLTCWVVRVGQMGFAYRWNMSLKEAVHTFDIKCGQKTVVACGPLLVEW